MCPGTIHKTPVTRVTLTPVAGPGACNDDVAPRSRCDRAYLYNARARTGRIRPTATGYSDGPRVRHNNDKHRRLNRSVIVPYSAQI